MLKNLRLKIRRRHKRGDPALKNTTDLTRGKDCMGSRDLSNVKEKLRTVGWFMPPYISSSFCDLVARRIEDGNKPFTQDDLELMLARVYAPERMASMVLNRYPDTPVITLFAETIAESVMAHFIGLHHVAVGGLVPVIEGAGRRLAKERGLDGEGHIKDTFRQLANYAREDVVKRRIGATEEIVSMLDSFVHFIEDYFYCKPQSYPLADKTNRIGIVHGILTDSEYGRPVNFYKTIAAIEFLTFISSLSTAKMSGFVPDHTPESRELASRYISFGKWLDMPFLWQAVT
jgi:hypothetical protein